MFLHPSSRSRDSTELDPVMVWRGKCIPLKYIYKNKIKWDPNYNGVSFRFEFFFVLCATV